MSQISSLYQNNGYLMSVIEPSEIVVGKDSIDLEIKVFEGRPFTINNVEISGNQRVDDEVIRREIYTRPGELYNRALLMQTLRQLSQMQHFDPASIMPQIQPVSNDLVDIGWPLVESASDKFEISGGWGAGMFVGSVGVQLNNLSVKNFFKKAPGGPTPTDRINSSSYVCRPTVPIIPLSWAVSPNRGWAEKAQFADHRRLLFEPNEFVQFRRCILQE